MSSNDIGPLVAYEAGEGCSLPIFNISIDANDPVELGTMALLRHLKEYRAAKLGPVLAAKSFGTFDITVASVENHQYGSIETSIYTFLDGKRHGLVLRTPMRKA